MPSRGTPAPPGGSASSGTARPIAWVRARLRHDIWRRDLDEAGPLERGFVTLLRLGAVVRRGFARHQLGMRAGSLTYITVFSLVPTLAVAFALFKAFGGLENAESVLLPKIMDYLAVGVREEVQARVRELLASIHTGAIGATGLLFLIVAAVALLDSIADALDDVWGVRSRRSWLSRLATHWAVVSIAPTVLLIAVSLLASARQTLAVAWLLESPGAQVALGILLPMVVVSAGLFFMYRFMTDAHVTFAAAAVGALTGGALWSLAAIAYSWYVRTTVYYDRVYGSLSAIPIFVFWIFVSWYVVLTGAVVAFAWQTLNTYRQEMLAQRASRRARELVALRVVVEAARSFIAGTGPICGTDLPERLHVSGRLVNEMIEELTEAGWLSAADAERRVVLLKDPDRTSPADLVQALRERGESAVWRERDEVTRALEDLQGEEVAAVARTWGEATFADLALAGRSDR